MNGLEIETLFFPLCNLTPYTQITITLIISAQLFVIKLKNFYVSFTRIINSQTMKKTD